MEQIKQIDKIKQARKLVLISTTVISGILMVVFALSNTILMMETCMVSSALILTYSVCYMINDWRVVKNKNTDYTHKIIIENSGALFILPVCMSGVVLIVSSTVIKDESMSLFTDSMDVCFALVMISVVSLLVIKK